MKIISVAEAKAKLSEYIKRSATEPVIITKNGQPTALLTSISNDDDLESIVLANSPKFVKIITDSMRRTREEGGIEHDQFWKEVEEESKK